MSSNNVVKLQRKDPSPRDIQIALSESSRSSVVHEEAIRAACKEYQERGWHPLKLQQGAKKITIKGWNTGELIFNQEDFNGYDNIGILLGKPSGNLIDIDLDIPEVLEAAHLFLPYTPAKFGRYYNTGSQKLGHWLYISDSEDPAYSLVVAPPIGEDDKNVTACELRSYNREDGKYPQTVFPPSYVYDKDFSGMDLVCWEGGIKALPPAVSDIPRVSAAYLKSCLNLLTASVLIVNYIGPKTFHFVMLYWAGMLAKAGYSKEDALRSVNYIIDKTGQLDCRDRIKGVEDSYNKLSEDADNNLKGRDWFTENIHNEKFRKWLLSLFRIKSDILDDGRPIVKVEPDKEIKLVRDTLEAMVKTEKFYVMGGVLTCVERKQAESNETDGKTTLNSLPDSVSLQSWLSREIQFVQYTMDKVNRQFIERVVRAPGFLCSELANPFSHRGIISEMAGLSTIPAITPKGRIVDNEHGYDPELKVFFSCTKRFTRMFPDEAINLLQEPFSDFPFAGGSRDTAERICRYRAAAISAILTAVVRPVIKICPMYVINSPQNNDGKSVLSGAIAASVGMEGGSANSPLTRGGSDEEQEKQISSMLLKGKRVVIYDNHDGEFNSPALTEVLTSENPEFRILGKSEMRKVPNRSFFIVNGVNMVLANDLQTRSVVVYLERRDTESYRKFRYADVEGWCYENHHSLVSAAISLIEWAMSQEDGDWRPTHRFKDWDRLVRRTVRLAFGVDVGPPLGEDEDRVMDPVEEVKMQFRQLVGRLWLSGVRAAGKKHYFCSKNIATEIPEGSDEEGWVDSISRRRNYSMEIKVGKALTAICGVSFDLDDKKCIIRCGKRDGRTGYWVEEI